MTTNISDFLAEQKRLADAATPGPWDNYSPNPKITPEQAIYSHWLESIPEARSSEIAALMTPKDAAFIAAARSSVPKLIAALEAVMALHRKNLPEDGDCQGFGAMPGGYGYLDDWCVECSEQSGREYGTDWPCATYRAIEAALGASDE